MTKVAIINDSHFGIRNSNLKFLEYYKKFYDEVFFPYIDEHKIKTVINLGDTFDKRSHINFHALHLTKSMFFDELSSRGIVMETILGNHDTYFKSTNDVNSPVLLLDNYSNINIYNTPIELTYDDVTIGLLPWVCKENYQESMNFINSTKSKYLFCHLDIIGFDLGGRKSDNGFEKKTFADFDLVLSGHYHKKQSEDNIRYLGAPYEMTWGDYNQQKGFHVIDFETMDLKYIQNPHKMFRKILYDDNGVTFEKLVNLDFDLYKNIYVKVIIRNKDNPYWFDLFMQKIHNSNPAHISVVEDHHNMDDLSDDDLIDQTEDTLSAMKNYIKKLNVHIDEEKLIQLIEDLYNEAITMDME